MKIGVCLEGKYKNRIIIPSFNLEGNLDYFIARAYNRNSIKYLNPPLSKDLIFNQLFLDTTKPITLVEGVFDVIVAENAIPILGSSLQENSKLFNFLVNLNKPIYMALDPDANEKEKEIINRLLSYGVDIFKVKVKPQKDVGELTRKEFKLRKENAIQITKENELELALME